MKMSAESQPTRDAVPANRYLLQDGMDYRAALRDGLEITGICVAGMLIILAIYYAAVKLLAGCFKPEPASPVETDEQGS